MFSLVNIKDFSIISPELGFLTYQKVVRKKIFFVQSSMISHSTITDGRCYDANFTKEKTTASSTSVIYVMSQSLNELSQIWNLSF